MALILIRADSQGKLLNALADIERHADLKIAGKPKIIDPKVADRLAKGILKQNLRSKCEIAVLVKVLEDITKSIMHIKKIHPPAHVVVISDEYNEFEEIKQLYNRLPPLKGYYSHK
ncbi:DUF356 domain-containing protein [Methanobacterium oryzae]|uniref:DUF356 domain-containing protein n=1 Tax=Methanobacterium oryzae TaxID=69540 RepID=UPI003D1AC522